MTSRLCTKVRLAKNAEQIHHFHHRPQLRRGDDWTGGKLKPQEPPWIPRSIGLFCLAVHTVQGHPQILIFIQAQERALSTSYHYKSKGLQDKLQNWSGWGKGQSCYKKQPPPPLLGARAVPYRGEKCSVRHLVDSTCWHRVFQPSGSPDSTPLLGCHPRGDAF